MCQELERQAERAKLVAAHDGVDLEYLKNIMLKLYETGDAHCHLVTFACMPFSLMPKLGTNQVHQATPNMCPHVGLMISALVPPLE